MGGVIMQAVNRRGPLLMEICPPPLSLVTLLGLAIVCNYHVTSKYM